jgi:hypothetical protein
MAGSEVGTEEPVSDEELTALALAADPDTPVAGDAVSLWDLAGGRCSPGATGTPPLPEWYMPAPMAGRRRLRGWRRWAAVVVIVAFLVIDAYGLCSTYGQIVVA